MRRREIEIYFRGRGAQDVGYEVLQVVGGLELDFAVVFCHFDVVAWVSDMKIEVGNAVLMELSRFR